MSEATLLWEVKMWTQNIKAFQLYERIKGRNYALLGHVFDALKVW